LKYSSGGFCSGSARNCLSVIPSSAMAMTCLLGVSMCLS
jgi:hypothetical protein